MFAQPAITAATTHPFPEGRGRGKGSYTAPTPEPSAPPTAPNPNTAATLQDSAPSTQATTHPFPEGRGRGKGSCTAPPPEPSAPPTAPNSNTAAALQDSAPSTQDSPSSSLSSTLESLLLAAAKARLTLIHGLEQLFTTSEDPVEKRRVSSNLLRATSAPLIPVRRDPDSGLLTPALRAAGDRERAPARPLPPPAATPSPDLTASDACHRIVDALLHNDEPAEDTGIATLAAFLDEGAKLNDEELPDPEDPDFADDFTDAVEDSPLALVLKAKSFTKVTGIATVNVNEFSETRPMSVLKFDFPAPNGQTVWLCFKVTQGNDTRHPGCFLINSLACRIKRDDPFAADRYDYTPHYGDPPNDDKPPDSS